MAKKVVTFGEVMMRLAPPGFQRVVQARSFDVTYAGAEASVAISVANYGIPADYVTRLPKNAVGMACLNFLRQYGIGTENIVWGGDRLGIYFLETGAMQRGSLVIYDRSGSSIATIEPGMVDWKTVFADADWLHVTGITPALSKGAAEAAIEAVTIARSLGLNVSADMNYRANLWKWGKKASEVMPDLMAQCTVAIGNEEDAEKVFGIKGEGVDVTKGKVEAAAYQSVCEQLKKRFPSLNTIAITLRGSLSASHNTWSGVLWDSGKMYTTRTYDLTHIVDRVGGGDAFGGGLIYGLKTYGADRQKALDFACAASCLKHSILGDANVVTVAEVEKLMGGDASGRVAR